jgi:thioredoxin 1
MKEGNEEDLNKILQENKLVVALFYATWCPHCIRFLPLFQKYENIYSSVKFLHVKIDDYENPLWEIFSIMVVPSILIFEKSKLSKRLNGILGVGLSEEQFKNFLETMYA